MLDSNLPDGYLFVVNEQLEGELSNGESMTGYSFLHITNANVGGFQIRGWGTKVMGRSSNDECQEVNFRVHYFWHDGMDPNYDYLTDRVKWGALKFAHFLGFMADPIPYNIHILWYQESTYRMIDKANLSTGWPLKAKGSPPR